MFVFDPGSLSIEEQPFPHAVIDGAFAPDDFSALEATYPVCPPASGPTGHTIHRGDALFDQVMAGQPSWRAFFAYCNSQVFVERLAVLFAVEIGRSCTVPADALRFADHIETRREKEIARIADPTLAAEAMFVRFDFMQGMNSYTRSPHLDHRRRLATLLVYFDSPGPDTFGGGDLVLHDASGGAERRISPAANRAVLFPCSDRSWHSVEAVTQCRRPRRCIQVSVSSCQDIWPSAAPASRGPRELVRSLWASLTRAA